MSYPVILNSYTNEAKTFHDVKEITIGRNVNSSIDIPSPYISRTQCILKLTENNEWKLEDQSRHHTTLLNDDPVISTSPILKNGDKISFLCCNDAGFVFYNTAFDAPNPAKKRKLDVETETNVDVLTPDLDTVCNLPNPHQDQEIANLNTKFSQLQEKYELSLLEINNQRRINEAITEKLNEALKESNESISFLQKEKEILTNKLREGELSQEKMVLEIQELNDLVKESELEQFRLTEECKCNEASFSAGALINDQPELSSPKKTNVTVSETDALQRLVEIVEIKWNEQEMEHMREELKKRDEKLTDLALETDKYRNDILDTLDREMLCIICNDILYQSTTLNCKHTFCYACVVEWKKKKKECPVCRTRIKTETRPLVIDSFIDIMAEMLGGDFKKRREEVKAERASKSKSPPVSNNRNSRRNSYNNNNNNNNRSNRRGRGNFPTISAAMSILQPLVVELNDNFAIDMVPPSVIDLTSSPIVPRRGGRRSTGRRDNYYNI